MKNNILASFFNPSQTAILIVVAVIGVLLIALNVVLAYLFHRRGERKLYDLMLQQQREMLLKELDDMRKNGISEEAAERTMRPFFTVPKGMIIEQDEDIEADEDLPEEEEEEAAETVRESVSDERPVRYYRSFFARLIQGSDEIKSHYTALKNAILAYDGVYSQLSLKREIFRLNRTTLASFVVRDKTLCICLAADPSEFTEYEVYDLTARSPKSKLPCMYKVVSDESIPAALKLIDAVFGGAGAAKIEREYEEYPLAYQSDEQLVEIGLIRIIERKPRENETQTTLLEEQVTEE